MMLKNPYSKLPGKARKAGMVPKAMPPPPRRKTFSELKPFGLKLLLKYKETQEFGDGDDDTTELKFQVWAEGEYCLARTAV